MMRSMSTANLDRAWTALASGEWELAASEFEGAAAQDPAPEVLDGWGRSLWWTKDVRAAIDARTGAYSAYKRASMAEPAALIAVWLARELRNLFRNDAAADGWLARAETLVGHVHGSAVLGWISLARAESSLDVTESLSLSREALDIARASGDADLEVIALARLGIIEIATAAIDLGVRHLDESMAAATGGETTDPQYAAEAYCCLMEAAELLGDNNRFAQWSEALSTITVTPGLGPLAGVGSGLAYGNLSAFCAACCGGMYLVTGRLDEAEGELKDAIAALEASGLQSRCVHPVTQLAELRVLQGRYEEARALLESYEDLPEAVRPLAVLDLALGDPESAAARLQARIAELDDVVVVTLPLHSALVDAFLATGKVEAARSSADTVQSIATLSGSKRHLGEALFAQGKVLAASSDSEGAPQLRAAALALSEASMALMACRARLELARALVADDRPLAISEARAALSAFDRLGAVPDADAAAAFLRDLGVKGRTGPKNLELLTKREVEVLRLVAQGLSNSEIAERLFISIKTSGHHVSNILAKLQLRSRTEAAAYAAIHLPTESAAR